jgi:hypothetical protein
MQTIKEMQTRSRLELDKSGREVCLGKGTYGCPRRMPSRLLKALKIYFSYKLKKEESDEIVSKAAHRIGWGYTRMAGSYFFTEKATGLEYYLDKNTMPFGMRMKKEKI